jgi:hypothetical protein
MPSIQSIHYMFTAGQVPGPRPGSANSTRIEAQTQGPTKKSLQSHKSTRTHHTL